MEGTAFAQFKWPERSSKRRGQGRAGQGCSFSLSLLCHLPTISLDLSPQEPAISHLAAYDCLAPPFLEDKAPLSHGKVIRLPSTLCVGSGWRRLLLPHGPGLSGQTSCPHCPALLGSKLWLAMRPLHSLEGEADTLGSVGFIAPCRRRSMSGSGQSSFCSSLHHFTQLVSCSCT